MNIDFLIWMTSLFVLYVWCICIDDFWLNLCITVSWLALDVDWRTPYHLPFHFVAAFCHGVLVYMREKEWETEREREDRERERERERSQQPKGKLGVNEFARGLQAEARRFQHSKLKFMSSGQCKLLWPNHHGKTDQTKVLKQCSSN